MKLHNMHVVYIGADGTMELKTISADVEAFDDLVGGTAYPIETLRLPRSKSRVILMGDFRNVSGYTDGMQKNPYENIYGNAFWARDLAGDFAGLGKGAEKEILAFYDLKTKE